MTTAWKNLCAAVFASKDIPNQLKPAVLAQAIGESGRGVSEPAVKGNNFWSLKFRDGLGVGWIRCADGYDYCYFPSAEAAVAVYWKFVHRQPYYAGVDDHLGMPADFIGFIGPTFCPPGYEKDFILQHGNKNYTDYILSFLPEATDLLTPLGWTKLPTAGPFFPTPPAVPIGNGWTLKIDRTGDLLTGPKCYTHLVKNFDRLQLHPQKIIFHFAAALGTGVMDGWSNPLTPRSAHFYVLRNGTAFQCVPLNFWAWTADGWNPISINIELENLGCFLPNERTISSWYDPSTDRFYRRFWPNIVQSAPRSEFVLLKHRKENIFRWWHMFPDAQIAAVIAFLPFLVGYCPQLPVVCGHDDVEAQKVDPGPAFPWAMIRK